LRIVSGIVMTEIDNAQSGPKTTPLKKSHDIVWAQSVCSCGERAPTAEGWVDVLGGVCAAGRKTIAEVV